MFRLVEASSRGRQEARGLSREQEPVGEERKMARAEKGRARRTEPCPGDLLRHAVETDGVIRDDLLRDVRRNFGEIFLYHLA